MKRPRHVRDIERRLALEGLRLIAAHGGTPSPAQDEVYEALKAGRVILTKRLVKLTATPAARWLRAMGVQP